MSDLEDATVGDTIREAAEQVVVRLELIHDTLREIENAVAEMKTSNDLILDALAELQRGQAKY